MIKQSSIIIINTRSKYHALAQATAFFMCCIEKFWNYSLSSLFTTFSLDASDFSVMNYCYRLLKKFRVSPIDLIIERLDLLI